MPETEIQKYFCDGSNSDDIKRWMKEVILPFNEPLETNPAYENFAQHVEDKEFDNLTSEFDKHLANGLVKNLKDHEDHFYNTVKLCLV